MFTTNNSKGFIEMKLLSVGIPCYNSAEYMAKAIESCLVLGDDIEIIVVDDGSKDNSINGLKPVIELNYKNYNGIEYELLTCLI